MSGYSVHGWARWSVRSNGRRCVRHLWESSMRVVRSCDGGMTHIRSTRPDGGTRCRCRCSGCGWFLQCRISYVSLKYRIKLCNVYRQIILTISKRHILAQWCKIPMIASIEQFSLFACWIKQYIYSEQWMSKATLIGYMKSIKKPLIIYMGKYFDLF